MTLQNRLRKEVNLFTGHFDEENTFKFKTKFTEDWEYIRFAEELHDFVEENKISEFVRRINNEHSDIFKRASAWIPQCSRLRKTTFRTSSVR